MTLSEELDELRLNVLRDQSDIVSGTADSLWTDETLIRYIKDGERRFARQTLCLRDATTPECVQVVMKTGVTTYPLHISIISVLSARYDTDTFDIQRSGHSLVLQFTPPEFLTYDPSTGFAPQPGRPIAFFTDETLVYARQARVTLTVYPVPSADQDGKILTMRVIRLPMTDYSLTNLTRDSEIPEDYQLECLEWAAYRAQRHFDADAGTVIPSDRHKAAFDEAVLNARKEFKRTMFANTTFRYGTNGFNWIA